MLLVLAVVIVTALLSGLRLDTDPSLLIVCVMALALTTLAINSWLGRYHHAQYQTGMQAMGHAAMSAAIVAPSAYLLLYALKLPDTSSPLVALPAVTTAFGMLVHRIGASQSGTAAKPSHRVLVLGTGDPAQAVRTALEQSDSYTHVVGHYQGATEECIKVSPESLLPRTLGLVETAQKLKVHEIVVALSERRGAMPLRELLDCKLAGINVVDLASHFEQSMGQIRLDAIRASWLIFGGGFHQNVFRAALKRLSDIVIALALLVVTLPVMLMAALWVTIIFGFPGFYRQERIGLHGRRFNVIKFRSVWTNAERDGQPRWASADDKRITRTGRFMRRFRVDKLPQLFNVLLGEMSMVGPRPERPYFVAQLTQEIPFYAIRHGVKPGVTGWAQVRLRYGASAAESAEKLQYDLYYVKNNSLFLDTLVLCKTVGVVLNGKGAR